MKFKILVIDDDVMMLSGVKSFLEKSDFVVETATSGARGLTKIRQCPSQYSLVILDYRMEGKDGATTAEEILSVKKDAYILIHSGDTSQKAAVATWRAGAVTFIEKSKGTQFFLETVRHWYKKYEDSHVTLSLPETDSENERLIASIGLIGRSPQLAAIAKQIRTFQDNDSESCVLIRGENGTGKELVAKAVHQFSSRRGGRFIAINTAALPENLVESELFGHEKGAFTGAEQKKIGKFLAAHKGTIFLDEIGDTSPAVQAKLLRVLQERTIVPVGSNNETNVDVRVVAATNVNLEEAIRLRKFREDLYYRLNVISINVPPLRERPEDIAPLVLHFCGSYNKSRGKRKTFLRSTVDVLSKYHWPGNVRELETAVLNLLIYTPEDLITPAHLDEKFHNWAASEEVAAKPIAVRIDEIRRSSIEEVLISSKSKREAARKLGLPFTSFLRLMRKYGLATDMTMEGAANEA